mgnify:CR=1 FL=1
MIDWIEEEKQYVNRAVDNYLKEQSKMPLGFMISRKTLNKNIEKVKKEATDRYRFDKLMKYRGEIEIERKRIDKVVEEINNKFNDYLESQKDIISKNIKPFKIIAKLYDNPKEVTLERLEVVTIQCEPFKLSFIQEKVGEIENE